MHSRINGMRTSVRFLFYKSGLKSALQNRWLKEKSPLTMSELFSFFVLPVLRIQMISMIRIFTRVAPGDVHFARSQIDH